MLKQFIRNKNNQKIGVLVADSVDGQVLVGWSLARRANREYTGASQDEFDVQRGLEVATGRMYMGSKTEIPNSIRDTYLSFVNRANRYYQDSTAFYPEQAMVQV